MRTLNAEQTLEHIYAGWLGKLIGVRLGAPVEMWTSEQILEKFGLQKGYLKDYNEFAADDDTNGPTFFIRALSDSDHYRDMTCEDVGRTWLNYPPWGKGMYWWGGYGISSEHTAYENLRAGVPAPRCGSMELNGKEVAQQIGGQIFSDAWGLVCPGNPELAASLSEKAARVSHDGEAVYGARFVASCIAAAFTASDKDEMIAAGLNQIPNDCTYQKVFGAVRDFYVNRQGDWQACLQMLRKHYWRDRFGGGCHIIPNAGIMALALYYGEGDFDETLEICNRCGFDTDCNVGNLGTMMGVLVGLKHISDAWREPINDFYACSSVVGALNLQDAASFSLFLASLAEKLGCLELPDTASNLPRLHFLLPKSTHGIRVEHGGETKGAYPYASRAFGGALSIPLKDGETRAFQRTYMRPDEFTDDRYSPAFSPTLYPGQTVTAAVSAKGDVTARLFVTDGNGNETHFGPSIPIKADEITQLRFTIPALKGACLTRVGVAFSAPAGGEGILKALDWQGMANYTLDFSKERIEDWSYGHKAVSQCTQLKGYWNLLERTLSGSCATLGECYTGDPEWADGAFSATLTPQSGCNHRFLFRVKGGAIGYGAELNENGLSLIKNDANWVTLATAPFSWRHGAPVKITAVLRGNAIALEAEGKSILTYVDSDAPLLHGQIGFGVANGSRCLFGDVCVEP